jgi:YidC/Oxa1 family membrane protein insertase
MTDQKNTLLAIVLSAIVLIVWQYFFGLPHMQRQEAQKPPQTQTQTQNVPTPAPGSTPSTPVPVPGQPAAAPAAQQPLTREAALRQSARVAIDTPSIKGSISLKGGRIDDISLSQFHETVDPKSPIVVLLSPSESPQPFYAEFGWVAAAGAGAKPRCPAPTRSGARKDRARSRPSARSC